MDSDVLSKARFALGESGVRRSLPTPGAFGPSAVGMSSTYWATDDAPVRRLGLCASGSGEARCDHRHDDRGHATRRPSRAPRVS